jgi:hypothetical protein
MKERPRTEHTLTPPTAEEWRMRNREARAKKQTELAEKIADRITPVNCSTIMTVADKIKEIAEHIGFWKKHEIQVPAMNIIELQNHIHELQTYLVHLEEWSIGMHD